MEIKMNFEAMERMIAACKDAEDQVEQTMKEIARLAEDLNGGGLLGTGGLAYYDALQDVLSPKMGKLKAKFVELQGDLKNAVAEIQKAEADTVSEIANN